MEDAGRNPIWGTGGLQGQGRGSLPDDAGTRRYQPSSSHRTAHFHESVHACLDRMGLQRRQLRFGSDD